MDELDRRSGIARWVLIGIGLLLVLNGIIVGGLGLAGWMPRSYCWLSPMFLALGTIGTLTAWLPSAALTLGFLLVGARAGSSEQGPQAGADLEAAQVVWSYDTGG